MAPRDRARVGGIALLLLSLSPFLAHGAERDRPFSPIVEGEILVRFKNPADIGLPAGVRRGPRAAMVTPSASLSTLHGARGLLEARRFLISEPRPMGGVRALRRGARVSAEWRGRAAEFRDALERTAVLRFAPGADLSALMAAYRADPAVESVEPHRRARACYTPSDPALSLYWGLRVIRATSAWDHTTGADVVVGVIDSGVELTHPDLSANLWTNPAEIPANGLDDDANGFIDDVRGWNFAYDNANPTDDNGHGTHVAGTVASTADNGQGGAGVAYDAQIMALKGLDFFGDGTFQALANAILYAVDNGADVINASWGGEGSESTLASAVAYAISHGVVFVAAAGNGDLFGNPINVANFTPASLPGVIAVGATDVNDVRASFSNFGTKLALTAPGVDVRSTSLGGGYIEESGTSMASPHVAGLAALVLSYWPTYTVTQVKSALTSTADDLGAAGFDIFYGHGRVNAEALAAVLVDVSSPSTPGNVRAVPLAADRLRVRWTASTDDHGVAGYRLWRDGVFVATVTATSHDDTGLAPDTLYGYTVAAYDFKNHESPTAAASARTPETVPAGASASATPFPNPARAGQDPTLRIWMPAMDRLEISIYDSAGGLVHRARLSGEPTGFVSGSAHHDYLWTEEKASGVYRLVAVGEADGLTHRVRARFTVIH
ncbi:MAG: S8 family serine peptidase [Elusimicrobia bacterium]|nr:S8 family serine peptidase [Elusimicrobiota bacterium]